MKVLIVGADEIFSLENYYVKYLKELHVEVARFSAQAMFYQFYNSAVRKILFRLGLSTIYKKINERLRAVVMEINPDIVLVFKGMEVLPETLIWMKNRKIKLINYNPDNPFIFSGKGSGNKNVMAGIPIYDLHFTYNLSVKKQLEETYKSKVKIIPFGFDVEEEVYEACLREEEILKACFVGNPDDERIQFLRQVADEGVNLCIYGLNWESMPAHRNIQLMGPVFGLDLWKVMRRYRVQINLMRRHNPDSHNMRTFEIPGVGGIMVAADTVEHRLFFSDGKEAFFFTDAEECARLIRNLMEMSPKEAMKIRDAARSRSLDSGYNYKRRAIQVLREIENLVV